VGDDQLYTGIQEVSARDRTGLILVFASRPVAIRNLYRIGPVKDQLTEEHARIEFNRTGT
jgi:hypothetical protein